MAAIASTSQLPLPYDFYNNKPLEVKFSGLDLSSDAGFLLQRRERNRPRAAAALLLVEPPAEAYTKI